MKKITRIEPTAARRIAKKRRVAAYCRVSTGMDDQLVSLEAQKEHYEDYISSNPDWEFAGLYYDEGISGTKKETRPALMEMVRDYEDGKIDFIITKSLSRFARNTTDCLELVRKLKDLKIPIYFEKENLDTGSMESELLLSIMSSLAESESVSISENNKWGIRHRYETGTYKIGYPPYGYSVKNGKLTVNEEEAVWVRFIFAEALAGASAYRIAKKLNMEQVPTKKGSRWRSSTILNILQNEKYVGDCLFQKTFSDSHFRRHKNKGQVDQFYVEGHHEPLISREDFEAVGRMIMQHAREKNITRGDAKYSSCYPFTKKIFCGECGSGFKRRINSTGGIKYAAWVCREHVKHRENCSMKFVRETALEDAFCTVMNKLIFARAEILQGLMDSIRSQSHKSSLGRINEIDEVLEGIEERRLNLTKIMTKGYIDPAAFTSESNVIQMEAASLEEEKERLIREISGDMRKTESLRDILKFTGENEMLTEFDAELFGRFVDHITVCSKDEAVFHLKCGLELKERIG